MNKDEGKPEGKMNGSGSGRPPESEAEDDAGNFLNSLISKRIIGIIRIRIRI